MFLHYTLRRLTSHKYFHTFNSWATGFSSKAYHVNGASIWLQEGALRRWTEYITSLRWIRPSCDPLRSKVSLKDSKHMSCEHDHQLVPPSFSNPSSLHIPTAYRIAILIPAPNPSFFNHPTWRMSHTSPSSTSVRWRHLLVKSLRPHHQGRNQIASVISGIRSLYTTLSAVFDCEIAKVIIVDETCEMRGGEWWWYVDHDERFGRMEILLRDIP